MGAGSEEMGRGNDEKGRAADMDKGEWSVADGAGRRDLGLVSRGAEAGHRNVNHEFADSLMDPANKAVPTGSEGREAAKD